LPKDQPVTGLNLRAQGQIVTALVPFTPGEPNASATGGLVGESGTVTPAQQREMEEAIAADAGGVPIPGKDKFLSPAGDDQAVAAASGSGGRSEGVGGGAAAAAREWRAPCPATDRQLPEASADVNDRWAALLASKPFSLVDRLRGEVARVIARDLSQWPRPVG